MKAEASHQPRPAVNADGFLFGDPDSPAVKELVILAVK